MSEKKTEVTLIKSKGKVSNAIMTGNDIEGYEEVKLIDAIGDVTNTTASYNRIVSNEALILLEKLKNEAADLNLDKENENQLNQHMSNIENTIGTSGFSNVYKEFTNFIAAHMTIMTPLMPFIVQLAQYIKT
ncbi:hypothetical protein [uncultured Shewanella sp.]|uniref:hypothetical protein n=1 Tax=uncultured Shewanella sp. TaxID=173975 RepID=UPI00260E94CB|nr:hypothetical protein [uncultured Shewanella sp.]